MLVLVWGRQLSLGLSAVWRGVSKSTRAAARLAFSGAPMNLRARQTHGQHSKSPLHVAGRDRGLVKSMANGDGASRTSIPSPKGPAVVRASSIADFSQMPLRASARGKLTRFTLLFSSA